MSADFLSSFLKQFNTKDEEKDVILNLLLKYIITTDKSLSPDTRNAYTVLQSLINGDKDKDSEVDPGALQLIREAFEELMTEMATVEIDEASIKAMLKPESFD